MCTPELLGCKTERILGGTVDPLCAELLVFSAPGQENELTSARGEEANVVGVSVGI